MRNQRELICMTHGHELTGEWNDGGIGGAGQRGLKRQKNGRTVIA